MDIALVYMVAGISRRFGGKIKPFAQVGPNNETLIEYSLNQAIPAGFSKIIFIVGNKTENPFREKLRDSYRGIPVSYALQKFDENERERPWGSADALCALKNIIDCPFVVCNGDDIYGKEAFRILVSHLETKSTGATIGYFLKNVLPNQGSVNRGIFELDSDNSIKSVREEFDVTKENFQQRRLSEKTLCSMNIYALYPETVSKLCEILQKFKEEHKGDRRIECLLPRELGNLVKKKELAIQLYPTNEKWFGVTNPEDESKVREELANLPI